MSKIIKYRITLTIIVNFIFLISIILCLVFNFVNPYFSIFITFLLFSFHMDYRIIVGLTFSKFKNRIDINKDIYKISNKEFKFLNFLKVKSWKDRFIALDKRLFIIKTINKENVSYVLKNNISAEIIHWFCFFFGFVSILIGCLISLQEWYIYLLTAIIASFVVDLPPILIQRYNRYRILKIKDKINL